MILKEIKKSSHSEAALKFEDKKWNQPSHPGDRLISNWVPSEGSRIFPRTSQGAIGAWGNLKYKDRTFCGTLSYQRRVWISFYSHLEYRRSSRLRESNCWTCTRACNRGSRKNPRWGKLVLVGSMLEFSFVLQYLCFLSSLLLRYSVPSLNPNCIWPGELSGCKFFFFLRIYWEVCCYQDSRWEVPNYLVTGPCSPWEVLLLLAHRMNSGP